MSEARDYIARCRAEAAERRPVLRLVWREACANVALKAQYPNLDDPIRAIDFVVNGGGGRMGAIDFLKTWQEGAWAELEREWPEFLEFCK